MAFEDRLKEARKFKGLTQEQLGKLIGVKKATISSYESGNSQPDVYKIVKLLEALEVDANYLWQDEIKTTPASDDAEVDDIARSLYDWLLSSGLLKPGEDLTEQQVKGISGVTDILLALFC